MDASTKVRILVFVRRNNYAKIMYSKQMTVFYLSARRAFHCVLEENREKIDCKTDHIFV